MTKVKCWMDKGILDDFIFMNTIASQYPVQFGARLEENFQRQLVNVEITGPFPKEFEGKQIRFTINKSTNSETGQPIFTIGEVVEDKG